MKIVLVLIHAVLIFLVAFLFAKKWNTTKSKLYWSSFVFHLLAGISVGLIYIFYYSANDTWLYFEDARKLSLVAHEHFVSYLKILFTNESFLSLVNTDFRALVFVKLLSVFCFLSGDSYWICSCYFSLISFIASWFLHQKIVAHFSDSTTASALAFLFFPSVVFWNSGIEKETLMLASVYFLSGFSLQVLFDEKTSWLNIIITLVASIILWLLKYYIAALFFVSIITMIVTHYLSGKNLLIKKHLTFTFIFVYTLVVVPTSFLHPNFYLSRFFEAIVINHDLLIPFSQSENLIHYHQLKPTLTSVLINSPLALLSGIFRPFLGEGQGTLGLIASIENFFIFVLFVSFLWSLKKHLHSPIKVVSLAVISYCIVLCIFLALSTPNLGTLSRYRVAFLPFLIFIFAYRNPLIELVNRKLSK